MKRRKKARRKEREAGRRTDRQYEHPIPGRDQILKQLERIGQPVDLSSLATELGLRGDRLKRALEQRLKAMVRDGQVIRNRASAYCLTAHLDLVSGAVIAHRDGYGFLRRDDGGDDLYISPREMQPLWNGDRVAARVTDGKGDGQEARIVEVLARARTHVVGTLRRERGIDYVLDESDPQIEVLIARGRRAAAVVGDVVRVEIVEQPTHRSHAIGNVVEIVGKPDQPGIETDVAVLTHGIPAHWPDSVIAEAEAMPAAVPRSAKSSRRDLRGFDLVTIDGADAKDFDDAVYCEPRGDGWLLIVAIADVSHYVNVGSALDREAAVRGTSVYFPDRVVPMLPEALSNGLCSLNPKVDRLCLACEMQVSANGRVDRSKFFNTVIRSAARLTYEEAADLLENPQSRHRRRQLAERLDALRDCYRALAMARNRRGAIDFDLPEPLIELDEAGNVARVRTRERLETHRLIEECMIAANVEAAKRMRKARIPGLYRVHEAPDRDRLDEVFLYLRTLAVKLPPIDNVRPKDLSNILRQLAGRSEAELIETMILRSMSQARYQPQNVGHFGLALDTYAHFTSPIRRYPDLLVHRAIKWLIDNGSFKGFGYSLADMTQLGERSSAAERRANEAVWDVEEQLKCAYMRERVGESFDGIVSSVVPFGVFVRIPELAVDGLVHVSALPRDYYHREASGVALVGERTGERFGLLDTIRVRVAHVSVDERKIDFVPEAHSTAATGARSQRAKRPPPKRRRRRG